MLQLTQEVGEQGDEPNTHNYAYKRPELSPGNALQHVLNLYGLSATEGIALLAIQSMGTQQRNNVFSQFVGGSTSSTLNPSIETPQRNVEITDRAGDYSTVQLFSQMNQLSLHTPPPSPLSRSATPKTTPKKKFNPPRNGSAIPHQQFEDYSKEKLRKFIQVVSGEGSTRMHNGRGCNHTFYMNHRVINSPEIKSDKPFKTIKGGGKAEDGKYIWEVFTDQENFKDLCKQLRTCLNEFKN